MQVQLDAKGLSGKVGWLVAAKHEEADRYAKDSGVFMHPSGWFPLSGG